MTPQTVLFVCLISACVFHAANGNGCNFNFTATRNSTKKPALPGSGTCTWTFRSKEKNTNIFLDIKVVSLVNNDTCSINNSIVIYDGDTTSSSSVLGILCNNEMLISSTAGLLSLQYPSRQVTAPTAFSVTFYSENVTTCNSNMVWVYSERPFSIRSPGYPAGLTWAAPKCVSIFQSTKNKRVLLSFAAGSQTSKNCSDISVTLHQKGFGSSVTWCPGLHNEFAMWDQYTIFWSTINRSQSLKTTYRALPASTCTAHHEVTAQEQHLTTTNYPQAYPSYEECRWYIFTNKITNGSIRIDITNSDLLTTENCYTDSLNVYSRNPPMSVAYKLSKTACDNIKRSLYFYSTDIVVIFKSNRANKIHTGLKLTYSLAGVEPSGGNVTANSTTQTIYSPGYPIAFPRYFECTWEITAQNPVMFVQVNFQHVDLYDGFSYDFIKLFDGNSKKGYVLGEVPNGSNLTFQGYERTLTVYFKTSQFQKTGFMMNYKQVATHPPKLRRHIDTGSSSNMTLLSPRYPNTEVKNIDAVWTIKADPYYSHTNVLLAFDDLDLGDKSGCSSNFVTVYNGNMSNSKARHTQLCGRGKQAFLSKGTLLTVKMKTDSVTAKKGFKANITSGTFSGCTGTQDQINSVDGVGYLQTLNYPYLYPNNMDCSYLIKAILSFYHLHFEIVSMDLDDTTCGSDYVEFFDGTTINSKSLGRYCGNQKASLDSSSDKVLVKFVSGSKGGGKGCKLSYQSVKNKDSNALVIGLGVGFGVLGLGLLLAAIFGLLRYKKQRNNGARF